MAVSVWRSYADCASSQQSILPQHHGTVCNSDTDSVKRVLFCLAGGLIPRLSNGIIRPVINRNAYEFGELTHAARLTATGSDPIWRIAGNMMESRLRAAINRP